MEETSTMSMGLLIALAGAGITVVAALGGLLYWLMSKRDE